MRWMKGNEINEWSTKDEWIDKKRQKMDKVFHVWFDRGWCGVVNGRWFDCGIMWDSGRTTRRRSIDPFNRTSHHLSLITSSHSIIHTPYHHSHSSTLIIILHLNITHTTSITLSHHSFHSLSSFTHHFHSHSSSIHPLTHKTTSNHHHIITHMFSYVYTIILYVFISFE